MAGNEDSGDKFTIQRIVVDPTKAPRAAHGFNWARLGNEYVFEVGFVDFAQAHASRANPELGAVQLLIVERFSLSPDAVLRLAETVKGLTAEVLRLSEEAANKSTAEPKDVS